MQWHVGGKRTACAEVVTRRHTSFKLIVRGVDKGRLAQHEALVAYLSGWCMESAQRDCPRVPEAVRGGVAARFIALLDAYRSVAFSLDTQVAPIIQEEFRDELHRLPESVREEAERVIEYLTDHEALLPALVELGVAFDFIGRLAEAAAAQVIAYELALLRNDGAGGTDAARWAGRAFRKLGDWTAAFRWYRLARRIAEFEEDWERAALVVDGLGNTYKEKGAGPTARKHYEDAWRLAIVSRSPLAIGSVGHSLMQMHEELGDLEAATTYGWRALTAQPDQERKSRLLVSIGTLMVALGDLTAARDAYFAAEALTADVDIEAMAIDGRAWIAALRSEWNEYDELRPLACAAARCSSPHIRSEIGLFRAKSLLRRGHRDSASRVLAACERYASGHGLTEWSVSAGELRDAIEAGTTLPAPEHRDAPLEVRQGLRALATTA